jgi:hypothetical protein
MYRRPSVGCGEAEGYDTGARPVARLPACSSPPALPSARTWA